MNRRHLTWLLAPLAMAAGLAACNRAEDNGSSQAIGAARTGFPGQVTAEGGTSGEVIAAAGKVRQTLDPSGTPGIPQGSGGNTGGAALGGTTAATGGATGTAPPPRAIGSSEGVAQREPDPQGTPGIPEGSGGNTGGTALGGTTGAQAESADDRQRGAPSR